MSESPAPARPTPTIHAVEARIRHVMGRAMFVARWLMAPIYLGLLAMLALVAVKFIQNLVIAVPLILGMTTNALLLTTLTLVDLSLVANLVVIVIFAGWENFVGRLLASHSADGPVWLGGLDFATVKLRLIGSVVAIAAIQILETFVHIDEVRTQHAAWRLAILLGIGAVGVLLALADRLSEGHGRK